MSEDASSSKTEKDDCYSAATAALRPRLPLVVVSQEPVGVCWSRSTHDGAGVGLNALHLVGSKLVQPDEFRTEVRLKLSEVFLPLSRLLDRLHQAI